MHWIFSSCINLFSVLFFVIYFCLFEEKQLFSFNIGGKLESNSLNRSKDFFHNKTFMI